MSPTENAVHFCGILQTSVQPDTQHQDPDKVLRATGWTWTPLVYYSLHHFFKHHLLNCFWQEFLVLTQKETPQKPQTSHCLVSVEGGCAAPLVRRTHIVYLSDVNHSHHYMSRCVVLRDQTADHFKTSSVLFSFVHTPLNRVMLTCPPPFSPYLKNKTRQPLVCFARNLSFSFLTDKRDQPHGPGGKSRNPAAQISKNVFYNSCLGIYIFAPSVPV